MNIEKLVQLGLSEKEAAVYIACLELGSSKVSQIAEKAKVARNSCYFLLSELVKKKLVREENSRSVKKFYPENPWMFIKNIEKKERKLKRKKQKIESLMGQLLRLYQNHHTFTISTQEGFEAIDIYRRFYINKGAEARTIYSYDEILENLPIKKRDDIRQRFIKHQKPITVIATSKKIRGVKKEGAITTYFLPAKYYKILGELVIYGDMIGMLHADYPHKGYKIYDKNTAAILKMLFDLALPEAMRIAKYYKEHPNE